jgi:hypothetical protein
MGNGISMPISNIKDQNCSFGRNNCLAKSIPEILFIAIALKSVAIETQKLTKRHGMVKRQMNEGCE